MSAKVETPAAKRARKITTLQRGGAVGRPVVQIVHGSVPYLWIGDENGNYIGSMPLTPKRRERLAEARRAI